MFRPNTVRNKGAARSPMVNVANYRRSRNRKSTDRDSAGSESSTGKEEEASGVQEEIVMNDKDEMVQTDFFEDDCEEISDTVPTTLRPGGNDPGVPSISSTNTSAANSNFVHPWRAPTPTAGPSSRYSTGLRNNIVSSTGPGSGLVQSRPFTTSHMFSSSGVKDDRKYPQDCYSFLAIYGPKKPMFFFFGMLPFVFQLLFLSLLLWSRMNEKTGTMGEVDNPSTTFFKFFPANASPIVRCTQLLSLASYVVFPDSSIRDIVKAIQNFPVSSQVQVGEPIGCMRFSCLLKFTQGFLAILATLLLIATSDEVVDIILILTALNFISYFDEYAFTLAMDGEFGPIFEAESKIIAHSDLPPCMYKDKARRHTYNMAVKAFICLTLFVIMTLMIFSQNSNSIWVTKELRVQFQEGTGLEEYSGCYEITDYSRFFSSSHRRNYENIHRHNSKTLFAYCRDYRQWVLFEDDGNNLDPCDAGRHLARSPKTDSFDISTSFDEPWVSSSGSPLDMFFFDPEAEKHCELKVGDGICDKEFNELGYQFDGGDCCADTCSGSLCGIEGLTNAFNVSNIVGDGFPRCKRPDTVPISILLNDIRSSRDPELVEFEMKAWDSHHRYGIKEDEWREKTPENPYFSLDCNDNNIVTVYIQEEMRGKNQTVWVQDGADCKLLARNTQRNATGRVSIDEVFDVEPIWVINYKVSYMRGEEGDEIEILSQHSEHEERRNFTLFPTCFFDKLENHTDIKSAYNIDSGTSNEAMKWLIDDEENGDCGDEKFVERYAVTKLFFDMNASEQLQKNVKQCTWSSIVCRGGYIDSIKIEGSPSKKSISTEIGLIENLRKLVLNKNDITTIPSEIGLLKKLDTLNLASNQITSISSQFGNLIGLEKLQLEHNNFTVTPSEIFLLNLSELHLDSHLITKNPTELGLLTSLRTLSLVPDASLSKGMKTMESIPSEIGWLTNLEILLLDMNKFIGIPSEICSLTNLLTIDLGNNEIVYIPTEIGCLTDLEEVKLDNNQLRTFPSEIGLLTRSQRIDASNNQLTAIPSEMGNLTSFRRIDLSYNNLTTIPSEIGLLTSLQRIDLSYNQLKSIPSEIGLLTSLQRIDISYNELTTIPSTIGMLKRVEEIYIDGNDLTCGEFPKEVENLCFPSSKGNLQDPSYFPTGQSMQTFIPSQYQTRIPSITQTPSTTTPSATLTPTNVDDCSDLLEKNFEFMSTDFTLLLNCTRIDKGSNDFTGTLPSELGIMKSLTYLHLVDNELTGTLPSELGMMTSLANIHLGNNKLTGSLPSELGMMTSLTKLFLGNNKLTGTLPSELGMMISLTKLLFVNNELTGALPTELGTMVSLAYLSLDGNELTGTLPIVLGMMTSLTTLHLDGNELTGTLPSELGMMTSLTYLNLGNNKLTGTLPSELGMMTSLSYLSLGDNKLTGTLPSELGMMISLTNLNLLNNELTGSLPTELGTVPPTFQIPESVVSGRRF